MNCEECNKLISFFLDDELAPEQASSVRLHLAECGDCARVFEDFSAILDVCDNGSSSDIVPPNSQALWCRINNMIESELKPELPPEPEEPRRGFLQFSFTQLASAVICIAIVSSLLTFIAVKQYNQPSSVSLLDRPAPPTGMERLLSRIGLIETPYAARERRLKEHRAAIEYWNVRVQSRRVQWDRTTRDAFDRNMSVIDEAVNEYTMILQQNPDDELSSEMLDTVLDDKMDLLRDFSDL